MHDILTETYSNWKEFERKIAQLESKKEKGDAFEDFLYFFFKYHKNYYQISEVYGKGEIPLEYKKELKLEPKDHGVDGLIVRNNGDLVAYQAKFKSDRSSPTYKELSTFWTESEYADYRYTVANSYNLPDTAEKKKKHSAILVDRFEKLDRDFFSSLQSFAENMKLEKPGKYDPYEYQEELIEKVTQGFKKNNRGKLIAASGTGKTLMSLWISEDLESKSVLFITPSLALIKQTLEEWSEQSCEPFDYVCVCSDKTVASEGKDSWDLTLTEMDVPVTTDIKEVMRFLKEDKEKKEVVFSSYHSLDVVSAAINRIENAQFDLAIFDEAHRTAGSTSSEMFTLGLHDENIPSDKRLFMTATEKLVKPRVKTRVEKYSDRTVFSMDNEELYGDTFARLPFGKAIKEGAISDYKIVLPLLTEEQLLNKIKQREYIKAELNGEKKRSTAENLAKQILLSQCVGEFPISKIFSFHSLIKNAKSFAFGKTKENEFSLRDFLSQSEFDEESIYVDHINGSMTAGKRREKFDEFERKDLGIITSVRCLNEGVDVPKVDCAFFSDPKESLIDIVQSSGRALRKRKDEEDEIAYLVVPIFMQSYENEEEAVKRSNFQQVFNVIQALRDQDNRLDEWVDEINLRHAEGSKGESEGGRDPVVIICSDFDVEEFKKHLNLKISKSIKEPHDKVFETKDYGADRSSGFERRMTTIGDYGAKSYKKSCVDPTIIKFDEVDEKKSRSEIKVDHNNISHTSRLGLVTRDEDGKYRLTELGKQYKKGNIHFEDLFKVQMLSYRKKNEKNKSIFPYRSFLELILKLGDLTKLEFLYGFYSMPDSSKRSLEEAIHRVEYIRSYYPNIEELNESNKRKVLKKLNEKFGLDFSFKDVWTSRTTTYNQFLYYRKQLDTFEFIDQSTERIKLTEEEKLDELLELFKTSSREYESKISNDLIEILN